MKSLVEQKNGIIHLVDANAESWLDAKRIVAILGDDDEDEPTTVLFDFGFDDEDDNTLTLADVSAADFAAAWQDAMKAIHG